MDAMKDAASNSDTPLLRPLSMIDATKVDVPKPTSEAKLSPIDEVRSNGSSEMSLK